MMTTFSGSQTRAPAPKCCLKMPIVPGPHTSCVIRISTSTQILSPGPTRSRPACRARICSVNVIGVMGSRLRGRGALSKSVLYAGAGERLADGNRKRGRVGPMAVLSPRKTCRLVTLGCKVNQYETQYVKEALEANGYREAAAGEAADLCLVNTCTVTGEADAKGRQLIRRLAQANPGAALVVMGCYATRDPETV